MKGREGGRGKGEEASRVQGGLFWAPEMAASAFHSGRERECTSRWLKQAANSCAGSERLQMENEIEIEIQMQIQGVLFSGNGQWAKGKGQRVRRKGLRREKKGACEQGGVRKKK